MKKTQLKDALKNISKQFVSYLSIIVISALAVTAFLGINYPVGALETKGSEYFKRLNLRDAEISSTMMLTPDDIEAIRNTEGVSEAEGIWQTKAVLTKDGESTNVYAHSMTEAISLAELTEGRFPLLPGDCAVEQELMEQLGLRVGDRITLGQKDGELAPFLKRNSFVIKGSFLHADHYGRMEYAPGDRYVLLADNAFDKEQLDGCFTQALVSFEKPEDMSVFSSAYSRLSDDVIGRLNALEKERAPIRESDVKRKYREEIDDMQAELDDAGQKLRDSRSELDDSARQIADKEQELADAKTTLENSRKQLRKAESDLANAKAELDATRSRLDAAKTELDSTAAQLEQLYAAALAASELGDMTLMAQYEAALAQYNAKLSEYRAGEQKYNEGLSAYNSGANELSKQKNRYENGLKKYNDGVEELENAKKELKEGEDEYAQAVTDYEEAEKDLQDAKDEFDKLSPCRWAVFNIQSNTGYLQAETGLDKIAMTFAMLFVVIGALVVYATVARIINEQRTLVGTGKALGQHNREILDKYLFFGTSATAIGIFTGIICAYFLMQRMILDSYEDFYIAGRINSFFDLPLTALALVIGILLAALSVCFACGSLVRLPAVRLLQGSVPSDKQVKAGKNDKRGTLYSRLIFRNMRSDAGRVIVTVISVAGCCVLLVIGFTISYGIKGAINKQYHDIFGYDQKITFDPEASETAERDIEDLLKEYDIQYRKLHSSDRIFSAGKELTAGVLLCGDGIDSIITMNVPFTGKPVVPGDEGICIQRRTAEFYHVGIGDTITLYDDDMQPYEIKVESIYENYFEPGFVMSTAAYKNVFGDNAPVNCFLLIDCTDTDSFEQKLYSVDGFEKLTSTESERSRTLNSSSALSLLTYLLIFVAGLMAFFILLNLANMFVSQKKRELTIMRVNGYTTKQAIAYVAYEAAVTAVIGIILGVLTGAGFGYLILRLLESRTAGLLLSPYFAGWGYAAGLTALYSVVIYSIALRKVKYLKLTDIN